ncbi:hypothetical protein R5R35_002212 [Gryllus longicercus]|uniref:Uncharacterized protein n=1 Tax=Gryllus longicercus TaxID=2509291 RepID=A0AAN9VLT9_9ORTH
MYAATSVSSTTDVKDENTSDITTALLVKNRLSTLRSVFATNNKCIGGWHSNSCLFERFENVYCMSTTKCLDAVKRGIRHVCANRCSNATPPVMPLLDQESSNQSGPAKKKLKRNEDNNTMVVLTMSGLKISIPMVNEPIETNVIYAAVPFLKNSYDMFKSLMALFHERLSNVLSRANVCEMSKIKFNWTKTSLWILQNQVAKVQDEDSCFYILINKSTLESMPIKCSQIFEEPLRILIFDIIHDFVTRGNFYNITKPFFELINNVQVAILEKNTINVDVCPIHVYITSTKTISCSISFSQNILDDSQCVCRDDIFMCVLKFHSIENINGNLKLNLVNFMKIKF